jgi:hypothetical protein
MSFEEESITSTPPDVSKTVVEEVMSDLLPKKSRQDCDQIYAYYVEWRKKKNVSLDYHSENILLTYMSELSQKYVPSTFCKVFSRAEEDLADQRACRYWEKHLWSRTFLKNFEYESTHVKKKAATFNRFDIERFLHEAPDLKFLHTSSLPFF